MERDEELARSLWPWLSERLARVGERVLELERELERGGGAAAALEDVRARTEAFGWLVGCVAEALGGAQPSPRRAPAGLGWMVEALDHAARERGLELRAQAPRAAAPGVTRRQAWECARVLWWLAGATRSRVRVLAHANGWAIEGEDELDLARAARAGLPGSVVGLAPGWRWSAAAVEAAR
jgi:hypothetical protein